MIRLVLVLCAGLYGVLALAGADHGQQRLGLTGAYAASTELPPIPQAPRPAAAVTKAVYTPAQPVMTTPVVAVVPAPQPQPEPQPQPASDIRYVVADAVNVRGGPSTGDSVVGRLTSGDDVLVVGEAADGWVEVLVEGDGISGFVASRFLTAPNQ